MAATIQLRGDTATNWTAANPVLRDRELAAETDTGQFKIGDGVTAWNALGYIQIGASADSLRMNDGVSPSAPSDGLLLYAATRANRRLLMMMGPSGLDMPLQPALFSNAAHIIKPSSGAAFDPMGGPTFTAVGTVSHPTLTATTRRADSTRRAIVTSAATANAASELRIAQNYCFRGDQPGYGGFYQRWRWGKVTAVANQRTAVGLWSATGATATTQNPSALTNCVFMGNDSADTNFQIMHNDASGACTKINLGSDFPVSSNNAIYDFDLFCPPNANYIGWWVKNHENGAVQQGIITTDLVAAGAFLCPHAYGNNGGTAAAVVLEFFIFGSESDF